jgi:hypothetical protein
LEVSRLEAQPNEQPMRRAIRGCFQDHLSDAPRRERRPHTGEHFHLGSLNVDLHQRHRLDRGGYLYSVIKTVAMDVLGEPLSYCGIGLERDDAAGRADDASSVKYPLLAPASTNTSPVRRSDVRCRTAMGW